MFTSIGAGLGDIFERGQTPDLAVVWEPQIILPILGLCLLSALPVLLKILRGKKGNLSMERIRDRCFGDWRWLGRPFCCGGCGADGRARCLAGGP